MAICKTKHALGFVAACSAVAIVAQRLDAATNSPAPAYSFNQLTEFNIANGQNPLDPVALDASGNLYGTTQKGGLNGVGTVFKVDAATHSISTLLNFNTANGAYPAGGLLCDAQGNLTGATPQGGTFGYGTAFQISAGTNALSILTNFSGSPAYGPSSTLVADSTGTLFGAANTTLYQISSGSPHTATQVASFTGTTAPFSSLVFDTSSDLYGVTAYGGTSGRGSLFRVNPATHQLTTLVNFTALPTRTSYSVVFDSAGNLYGVNSNTIFEIPAAKTLSSTAVTPTILYTFTGGSDGGGPIGPLVVDANGDLFGTTSGGGVLSNTQSGSGTVFELTAGPARTLNTLYTFDGAFNGSTPGAGLVMDASGNLYGTTTGGGADFSGTVFELSPLAVPEPATLSLLTACSLGLLRRRRATTSGH